MKKLVLILIIVFLLPLFLYSEQISDQNILKFNQSPTFVPSKASAIQIQKQDQARIAAQLSQNYLDGIWINNTKNSYTYNIDGKLIEYIVLHWQHDVWLNNNKEIYTYDTNGNLTEFIIQRWKNDAWLNNKKEIYTYDANGNMTEFIDQRWKNDVWANDEKETYTYNTEGNLIEKFTQEWDNDIWSNDSKFTYTYDENGNQTESVKQTWQDDIWVNYRKHTYVYDLDGNIIEHTEQIWFNDFWLNMAKEIYTYDINGNVIEHLDQNWDDTWVNSMKRTYTYDNKGNQTEHLIQMWKNDIWEYTQKYTYVYDINRNEIENLHQIWENNLWVNYRKKTYNYDTNGNLINYLGQNWEDDAWVNSGRNLYAYENCAPVLFSIPDMTINCALSFSYTVLALGSPLPSFTLVNPPAEMTINDSTGLIKWTTELGTYQIVVQVENVYGSSNTSFELKVDSTETSINNKDNTESALFALIQNYPNPFNSSTKISYSIPTSGFVKLIIYDLLGKEIRTLVSKYQQPDTYNIYFDASSLSSGIYFYRLQVGSDFIETRRMLLIR